MEVIWIIIFQLYGGDLRIVKLAKMFAKDNKKVYVYGLEKAKELENIENIIICNNLEETIKKSETIIGPVPFSKNQIDIYAPFSNENISILKCMQCMDSKTLIAGSIKQDVYEITKNTNIKIIDIMKKEELAILNTIATAEGAIEVIISNTETIIHGSNILILGFGRVGKVMAQKLNGLSANITCAARKSQDYAWIETYGYVPIDINKLGENLSQYDVIINTVPHLILTKERLEYVRKDCLIVDLASAPGGVDREEANNKGIQVNWALALPGKVAPITSAKFIKDVILKLE